MIPLQALQRAIRFAHLLGLGRAATPTPAASRAPQARSTATKAAAPGTPPAPKPRKLPRPSFAHLQPWSPPVAPERGEPAATSWDRASERAGIKQTRKAP